LLWQVFEDLWFLLVIVEAVSGVETVAYKLGVVVI
jgi:hypothetical protein